jgi:hypothetical protein
MPDLLWHYVTTDFQALPQALTDIAGIVSFSVTMRSGIERVPILTSGGQVPAPAAI